MYRDLNQFNPANSEKGCPMTVYSWPGLSRGALAEVLPEALVVLPIGAVEQHGPHLPTGTDAMLAEAVAHGGAALLADKTEGARDVVLAPTMVFGASDHHLAFGGTLSLSVETMHGVLTDLARSVFVCGGQRLVIINGHGGNGGVMRASAAAASSRMGIAIAVIDYWDLLPDGIHCEGDVPGHAGAFETALMLAARPNLDVDRQTRAAYPTTPAVPGTEIHSTRKWQDIDGYTDNPGLARSDDGQKWLDQVLEACADRLGHLATVL